MSFSYVFYNSVIQIDKLFLVIKMENSHIFCIRVKNNDITIFYIKTVYYSYWFQIYSFLNDHRPLTHSKGRRGRDRMVVGLLTTYAVSA